MGFLSKYGAMLPLYIGLAALLILALVMLPKLKGRLAASDGQKKKKKKPKAPPPPKPKPIKKAKPVKVDFKKRFDFLRQVGQGSMSKVFQVRDRTMGRVFCAKIMDRDKHARFEARFLGGNKPSEGEICCQLRHPNIVQTFEHGITMERHPFILMEMIEGMGLNFLVDTRSEKLRGKRITYLAQIADALAYVHSQGFFHRDVCPRNVMINQEGNVKLIDFGLSIPNLPLFVKPGNRTGTPSYLAPELIRRVPTDHRVDLFALGVTAYELYSFALPWEKGQSLQTLQLHVNIPGRDPRDFAPDLPEPVCRFLIKAIERDPRDRFQSAGEFKEALLTLPPHL